MGGSLQGASKASMLGLLGLCSRVHVMFLLAPISVLSAKNENRNNKDYNESTARREMLDTLVVNEKDLGDVSWDSIFGQRKAKQDIQSTIKSATNKRLKGAIKQSSGMLFFGPPGNGKTFIVQVVAKMEDANFFNVSASAILDSLVGKAPKRVKALFDMARAASKRGQNDAIKKRKAPIQAIKKALKDGESLTSDQQNILAEKELSLNSEETDLLNKVDNKRGWKPTSIVFIDEVDSLLPKGGGSTSDGPAIRTSFLTGTVGLGNGGGNVIFIGATNYPDKIDEAMLSRMKKQIFIRSPDDHEVIDMVRQEMRSKHNDGGYLMFRKTTKKYAKADTPRKYDKDGIPIGHDKEGNLIKWTDSQKVFLEETLSFEKYTENRRTKQDENRKADANNKEWHKTDPWELEEAFKAELELKMSPEEVGAKLKGAAFREISQVLDNILINANCKEEHLTPGEREKRREALGGTTDEPIFPKKGDYDAALLEFAKRPKDKNLDNKHYERWMNNELKPKLNFVCDMCKKKFNPDGSSTNIIDRMRGWLTGGGFQLQDLIPQSLTDFFIYIPGVYFIMNTWFPSYAPWRDQGLILEGESNNGNSSNMSTLTTMALAGVTAAAVNGVCRMGNRKKRSKSSDTETVTEGGFLGIGGTTRTVEKKKDNGPSTMMIIMGVLAFVLFLSVGIVGFAMASNNGSKKMVIRKKPASSPMMVGQRFGHMS